VLGVKIKYTQHSRHRREEAKWIFSLKLTPVNGGDEEIHRRRENKKWQSADMKRVSSAHCREREPVRLHLAQINGTGGFIVGYSLWRSVFFFKINIFCDKKSAPNFIFSEEAQNGDRIEFPCRQSDETSGD
jgi:hypothetical protein